MKSVKEAANDVRISNTNIIRKAQNLCEFVQSKIKNKNKLPLPYVCLEVEATSLSSSDFSSETRENSIMCSCTNRETYIKVLHDVRNELKRYNTVEIPSLCAQCGVSSATTRAKAENLLRKYKNSAVSKNVNFDRPMSTCAALYAAYEADNSRGDREMKKRLIELSCGTSKEFDSVQAQMYALDPDMGPKAKKTPARGKGLEGVGKTSQKGGGTKRRRSSAQQHEAMKSGQSMAKATLSVLKESKEASPLAKRTKIDTSTTTTAPAKEVASCPAPKGPEDATSVEELNKACRRMGYEEWKAFILGQAREKLSLSHGEKEVTGNTDAAALQGATTGSSSGVDLAEDKEGDNL
eukprot:Nk52_evm1s8 gene=Nk52_evmTU1s8